MTLRAPRLGEVLAALGGAAILVSLFGGWPGIGVLEVLLVICAGLGLFVLFTQMTQPSHALTVAFSGVGLTLSFVTVIWAAIRVLGSEGGGPGYLALAGIAAILAGCMVGLRDEGTSFLPGVEEPANRP